MWITGALPTLIHRECVPRPLTAGRASESCDQVPDLLEILRGEAAGPRCIADNARVEYPVACDGSTDVLRSRITVIGPLAESLNGQNSPLVPFEING